MSDPAIRNVTPHPTIDLCAFPGGQAALGPSCPGGQVTGAAFTTTSASTRSSAR